MVKNLSNITELMLSGYGKVRGVNAICVRLCDHSTNVILRYITSIIF